MIAHRNGEHIRNRLYRNTPAFTIDFVAPLSSAAAMNRALSDLVKQPVFTERSQTVNQPIHVSTS
jgi:hypothetical protein